MQINNFSLTADNWERLWKLVESKEGRLTFTQALNMLIDEGFRRREELEKEKGGK